MRVLLVLLIVTLAIGLIAGTLMAIDAGYVLVSWSHYTMETSVWIFIAMTLVAMGVFYALLRFSLLLLGSDWRFNEWRRQRRNQRARRQTTRGLLSLAQGQWRRAERMLTLSADDSDTPLINYLAAARAAYEQGKMDAADEWLKAASQSTKGAELAVGLTQAELLNSRGQKEQALAVLLTLRKQHPKHAYLLKLLVKTYLDLEDWVALQDLLPLLRKSSKIPAEKIRELEENVHLQLLERAAHGHAARKDSVTSALKHLYQEIPRNSRYSLAITRRYIELLKEAGEEKLAEQELRNALKYVWHDDLISLYGALNGDDPNRQLLFAEQQLQERPNDPVLLLVLGKLARREGDLEKAREYLQTGLRIKGLNELHAEMGQVLLAEGDETLACEHFQLALR
ncbi:heme biosynthesis HemY N-terminal domain-containing protein [Thalassolituus marinus]|jgi:HemY protein|uniref:Heme biosynthesis protein HemY n=1 Tax=Thalassolituus marinus TaxID=671053 RepID=A0ABS7ZPS6_9GAMM|nr:heme biosynthesis HemY N-terminal domain-containing protein [Thalassolituus marinus]MCA6063198.1 heme biosynthesis protein HemY [Thalassolituus marinus]